MVLKSLSLALEVEATECWDMKTRLVKFGEIEVEGKRYTHDVVITAPTLEVCQLLEEVKKGQAYAILHCTC
jgi:hypothetical protein